MAKLPSAAAQWMGRLPRASGTLERGQQGEEPRSFNFRRWRASPAREHRGAPYLADAPVRRRRRTMPSRSLHTAAASGVMPGA